MDEIESVTERRNIKTSKLVVVPEMQVKKSWLVLVLHVVGWKSDPQFLDQSQIAVQQSQHNRISLVRLNSNSSTMISIGKMVYTAQCTLFSASLSDMSFDVILQIPRSLPLICAQSFDGYLVFRSSMEWKKNQLLNQIHKGDPLKNQSY